MEDLKLKNFDLQLFADGGNEDPDKGGDEPQKDDQQNKDEKTFSQADLDKIVAERLGRESKKYAKDLELLEKLKTQMSDAEKEKLEIEKIKQEAQEAREALAKIAEEKLNSNICKETGLPDFLTGMLSGDEKERMTQAKELVKKLNNGQIGNPTNQNTDTKKNPNSFMNAFLRG